MLSGLVTKLMMMVMMMGGVGGGKRHRNRNRSKEGASILTFEKTIAGVAILGTVTIVGTVSTVGTATVAGAESVRTFVMITAHILQGSASVSRSEGMSLRR